MAKRVTVGLDDLLEEVADRLKGRRSYNAYILDLIEKDGRDNAQINLRGELNPRPGEWPAVKEQ